WRIPVRLMDKVVLVTGAAGGLGRSTAELFAREGAKLVLVDLNEAELMSTTRRLQKDGAQVAAVVGDVSRSDTADAAIAKVEIDHGRLDILLNNAGINPTGTIVDTPEEVWDRTM